VQESEKLCCVTVRVRLLLGWKDGVCVCVFEHVSVGGGIDIVGVNDSVQVVLADLVAVDIDRERV